MTPKALREHIQERIEHHEYVCSLAKHEPKDDDLVMVLHGKSARGIGVRPMKLGSQFNPDTGKPEWIYGFSLKQCRKLLDELDKAE